MPSERVLVDFSCKGRGGRLSLFDMIFASILTPSPPRTERRLALPVPGP